MVCRAKKQRKRTMKKLMMAVAAIAIAMGVQAANVDWKIQLNANEVGTELYAVLGSSISSLDLASLALTDVTGNALTWSSSGVKYDSATVVSKSGKGTPEYTSIAADALTKTDASIYLIAVTADEKQYAVLNGSAYDVSSMVFNDGETKPGTFSVNLSSSALTYSNFTAVPEPTSGLLMLLGVAGLALRRRRA